MGPQFHETGYGRKFFEVQLPNLIKVLSDVSSSITVSNNLTIESKGPYRDKTEFWRGIYSQVEEIARGRGIMDSNAHVMITDELLNNSHYFCDTITECIIGSCRLYEEDQTALPADDMLAWFDNEIAIARTVGPIGAATLLTLIKGRDILLASKEDAPTKISV